MNILKLAQLVEKFSSVVKRAIALDFKPGHGYLLLDEIKVPSSSGPKMYTVRPGTVLMYLESREELEPKIDPETNEEVKDPETGEAIMEPMKNHYWKLSGWSKGFSTRKFNPVFNELLDLRDFFSNVARLLPGGEFNPSMSEDEGNDGEYVYIVSAYPKNGTPQLYITVSFGKNPPIQIEIEDYRHEKENMVMKIPDLYTIEKPPGEKYPTNIVSQSTVDLFKSPRKFLDTILPHDTSSKFTGLLDEPYPLDEEDF
jgi:hypothetical protein